jgi:hypothetical protein
VKGLGIDVGTVRFDTGLGREDDIANTEDDYIDYTWSTTARYEQDDNCIFMSADGWKLYLSAWLCGRQVINMGFDIGDLGAGVYPQEGYALADAR